MAQRIDLSRDPERMTRTELTLGRIGQEWRYQAKGEAFTAALLDFLRSLGSPKTLSSYSFSILQFFEWYEEGNRRIPTPDRVRRADAIDFTKWLYTRDQRLIRKRLQVDPSQKDLLRIFDFVGKNPGQGYQFIRQRLAPFSDEEDFIYLLGCMVKRQILTRTPTVAEYRREHGGLHVPPAVFHYYVPYIQTEAGSERASTIVTRLSALSSLWTYFIRNAAENVPGREEPLLRFNIWDVPLKQAAAQAPSHQAVSRAQKQTGLDFFLELLATTFYRTHGSQGPRAFEAAKAAFWGNPLVPPSAPGKEKLNDVRDQALLIFMVQTGARSVEIHRLLREHYRPPYVTLFGKRNKKRTVIVPPAAHRAWLILQRKLQEIAGEGSPRARRLLEDPQAPFFPAVRYWGANAGQGEEKGLTRPGIALMLRRRAEKAGIAPDSPDFSKAHPHGLRGLFARLAIESGTPINRVQAMLGHSSVATTGTYMEEHRPEKLVAKAFVAPQAELASPALPAQPVLPARPARPVRPPPVRTPKVVVREEEGVVLDEPDPEEAISLEAFSVPALRPPKPKPVQAVFLESEVVDPGPPLENPFVQVLAKGLKRNYTPTQVEFIRGCFSEFPGQEPLRNLCIIYKVAWGEKGIRQAMKPTGGRKTASETAAERLSKGQFTPNREAGGLFIEDDAKRIYQTFVGKLSGLTWWTGTKKLLEPNMPVMSPSQARDLLNPLEDLWSTWAQESITKAKALERWYYEALQCTAQVQEVIDERDGFWVEPVEEWDSTQLPLYRPPEREVFRKHLDQKVLQWFELRGGTYTMTLGEPETRIREGQERQIVRAKVEDEPPPMWFTDRDPIEALPTDERDALLAWLAAATGQKVRDKVARFRYATSRQDVAEFVNSLCSFDSLIDEVKGGDLEEETRGLLREQLQGGIPEHIQALVEKRTQGRVGDYNVKAAVEQRRARTKTGDREARWKFYRDQVVEVFGPEAAQDPVVQEVVRCSSGLTLGDFLDLFRIERGTIRHEPSFKRVFAKTHLAHSECVARRLARLVWEIRQDRIQGMRQYKRPDLMQDLVKTMQSTMKAPCSFDQERELRQLVPEVRRGLRDELDRAETAPETEDEDAIQQMFSEFEEGFAWERGMAQIKEGRATPNGRRAFFPNPMRILFAAFEGT